LAKGNTTIERRGTTKGWPVAVVAATAGVAVGEDLIGQSHQVTTPITSTAASAAPIGARMLRR
jgi:hypothetical protein